MWFNWLVFCDYGLCVCPLMPLATPTILLGFLLPWTCGISSQLLQQSAGTAPYLGWGVSPHSWPSWPWMWSSSSRPSCTRTATSPWMEKMSFSLYVQKRCPFHYRGLKWKSGKSRNTWSIRQIKPCNTEWSRAKANRVLPRERTGHSKHPLPTTQEKTLHMDITRWSTPKSDWLYSLQPKMEKLYTVSKNKTRSWLWLRSWTPYCQIQTEIEESGENH